MPRDFLKLVGRPTDLLKALRRITLGGVIAATGLSASPSAAAPSESSGGPAPSLTPTIVDRSRKAARLVLQLPGTVAFLGAAHRSHRSHSSHRSSSGGGAPAPVVPQPPPVRTPAEAPITLTEPTTANTAAGEVVAIDTNARTIVVKQSATVRKTFSYRDDSKFETALGATFRFDDFADANNGRVPLSIGDKVQIKWRMNGKTQIVTTVQKTR